MGSGREIDTDGKEMSLRRLMGRVLDAVRGRNLETVPDFAELSWAQEGEDLLLRALFERVAPQSRFFVDVGAHHPQRFSNTWLFYQRGWRGINIDPFPGCMADFDRTRPRDINIEMAVTDQGESMKLFLFNDAALSTSSTDLAGIHCSEHGLELESTIEVPATTLTAIFEQHLSDGFPIDFMSVDVEGAELEVLRSMDWKRWRPTYLLIEELADTAGFEAHPTRFLNEVGYGPIARTPRTVIYQDCSGMQEIRE
jgi:FkbM family methyltransferase